MPSPSSPTAAPDRAASTSSPDAHADRVRFLYRRLPAALAGSLAVAIVLAVGEKDAVPFRHVSAWLVFFCLCVLGRLLLGMAYQRAAPAAAHARVWQNRFRVGSLIAGLSWAAGAYVFFPSGDTQHQAFVAFAIAGVTAGAATSMAPDRPSFLLFAGPPLATLLVLFAVEPGLLARSMGAMVFFYGIFLATAAAQSHSWLRDLNRLQREAVARAEKLAASEERLHRLFNTTSDLIQSVGPNRRITFVNRAWRDTLGYGDADAIGRDALDFVAPECRDLYAAVFADLKDGKDPPMVEMIFIGKDGRRIPLEGNIVLHAENGQPMAMRAFFRDISARKAAEEALRSLNAELEGRVTERTAALVESERFNRSILDSIGARLAVLDHEGRIIATNASWNQNLPADWEAWQTGRIGDNYLAVCDAIQGPHAGKVKAMAAGIRDVIAGRQSRFRLEYSIATEGGRYWYTLRVTSFAPGGPRRVVITHSDITTVQEAIDKAAQNERILVSLARASPVGFFRARADSYCEYVNQRWCEIAGLSEASALGFGYMETLHPDDRTRVLRSWHAATDAKVPFHSEHRFQRSDGTVCWVLTHAVPTADSDGRTASYVGTLTDITDRKRIEMAMQALSSDLINLEGTAYLEAAALKLTQLLDMELAGISQYSPHQPDTVRLLTMAEDGVIKPPTTAQLAGSPGGEVSTGRPLVISSGAQVLYPKAGLIQSHRIDSYIGEPLKDPAGRSLGHVAAMSRRPIRDIKTATTILRMFAVAISATLVRERNQRQYSDLFQFAPDGLLLMDRQGGIRLANLRAETDFGWTRKELRGRGIDTLLVPEAPGESLDWRELLAPASSRGRRVPTQLTLQGRRRDGSSFPAEVHLAQIESDHGITIAAAIRDITARRTLESQLAQANRLEAIGRITGGLAHDFNNYLGVIIGHLDLLQDLKSADAQASRHIAAALNGALRSAELTQSLLAYSRKQPLVPMVTDITQRIGGIMRLLEHTLGKDVVLTIRTADDLWPIKVDGAQFDSCLVNLATNARDAMPNGGLFAITARNTTLAEDDCAGLPDIGPGDYVWIAATDSGQGMTPEVLAQVFEPFFTTKVVGHGTGLGLSMVYGFVRQSGGNVKITSTPGKGTRVEILLPRTLVAASTAPDDVADGVLPHGSETILVVEDNDRVLRAAIDQIESLGYRVIGASDAEAALATLERDVGPDLLLTDIVMPGSLNGYQLAAETRRRRPDIKILLTSGFPGEKAGQPEPDGEECAPLLQKPYRKDQLAKAIRRALDTRPAA